MTHILVPGTLTVDLTAPFTQQGIYNLIRTAYPTSPDYSVVGIAVPLVAVNCIDVGVIDPVGSLKDAVTKLYNYFMQYYIQPIWNALYSLYDTLKQFGLGIIDFSIGILDLTISDLFDPNLYETLKAKVLNLYYNAKQTLVDILNLLDIKYPINLNVTVPQFDIEYIVNSILSSLWGFIIRFIKQLWSAIATGLRLWEIATQQGAIVWSQIWNDFVETLLGGIIGNLLTTVPTLEQIYNALVAFAKNVYNKAVVTYEEIIAVIKDFTFFGFKPFDWDFPWNPNTNFPEVDLMRILNSMLQWLKNFVFRTITQAIQAIEQIFSAFGIALGNLATISIPITFCAVAN